eukprot:gnl/MRDRNA2_/MRDRNA2_162290_c0_seq1.p1 gnl/MRDRNA2_/MRDRNA2_162290_c0~~gnl/MRDRNA2_/MRDRNA2_162290_c0_seq1.p1  ORF type:complete len:122 (+),score=3.77 gnl/MRDRNA2_/MRDRNA2_162290_c0_seq1:214-579(+)
MDVIQDLFIRRVSAEKKLNRAGRLYFLGQHRSVSNFFPVFWHGRSLPHFSFSTSRASAFGSACALFLRLAIQAHLKSLHSTPLCSVCCASALRACPGVVRSLFRTRGQPQSLPAFFQVSLS